MKLEVEEGQRDKFATLNYFVYFKFENIYGLVAFSDPVDIDWNFESGALVVIAKAVIEELSFKMYELLKLDKERSSTEPTVPAALFQGIVSEFQRFGKIEFNY